MAGRTVGLRLTLTGKGKRRGQGKAAFLAHTLALALALRGVLHNGHRGWSVRAGMRLQGTLALALVVALALVAGCTRAPQESVATPPTIHGATQPPTVVAVRNDPWKLSADGNASFKIVVVEVTPHGGPLTINWTTFQLDAIGGNLTPSSAYAPDANGTAMLLHGLHDIPANVTVPIELHYRTTQAPAPLAGRGTLTYPTTNGTATIDYALPNDAAR